MLKTAFGSLICALVLQASLSVPSFAQHYHNPEMGGGAPKRQAEFIFSQAKRAYKGGDYMAAIELCKRARSLNPGDKDVPHLMALSYAESGDNYNANIQFLQCTTMDYNFIEARNNYGLFLMKTGKVTAAKNEFEKCIKINPNYPDAHYSMGTLLRDQGDLDNAVDHLRTAIKLRPNYFAAKRELGLCLKKMYDVGKIKDISGSVDELRQAAQLLPNDPLIHYYLAQTWCEQGNLDEGEKEFRLSLRNDPSLAAGHYELARLRYLRGDPDRCLSELKSAFKVNPRYTESHRYPSLNTKEMRLLSAKCNDLKCRYERAAADYMDYARQSFGNAGEVKKKIKDLTSKAKRRDRLAKKNKITYDPQEVQAVLEKGISLVDEGDFQTAKRAFMRVNELNAEAFEGYQNLGSIYEVEGDYQRAMGYYKKAMELEPDYDGLYYNMGYVLEKMRLPIEAGRMYEKYHDLAGKYPYDPKHIINLRLIDARQKARDNFNRKYQSGF